MAAIWNFAHKTESFGYPVYHVRRDRGVRKNFTPRGAADHCKARSKSKVGLDWSHLKCGQA